MDVEKLATRLTKARQDSVARREAYVESLIPTAEQWSALEGLLGEVSIHGWHRTSTTDPPLNRTDPWT